MTQFRIGFDIGGTKVTGILLGPDGVALAKERWPVPEDYAALLALLAAGMAHFQAAAPGIHSVGVGVAGIIDHRQGMLTLCKLPWLQRQPFAADLARKLQAPVRIANDADCFAVSEAMDGAGAGYQHVFGAIIGTGAGGAQVVEKKLVRGPNGVNGEWGHLPLPHHAPEDGPLQQCHCGRMGCIDTIISGGGLARLHQFLHPEMALTAPEIARLASQGDKAARQTLERFYAIVAKGLSMIVLCMDPDAIVIGGGLRDLPGLCAEAKRRIPDYCFVRDLKTDIVPAAHDADSGVRGAAWLT